MDAQELSLLKHQLETLQKQYDALKKDRDRLKAKKDMHSAEFWSDVKAKLKNDTEGVKALIRQSTISVNDVMHDGHTLLTNAAYFGNYEIVQLALNLGADIAHQTSKGRTALAQANRVKAYHVEQLLWLSEMEADIGGRMNQLAQAIQKQTGVTCNILREIDAFDALTRSFLKNSIIEICCKIVRKKLVFSDDWLMLAWTLEQQQSTDDDDGKRDGDSGDNKGSVSLWSCIRDTAQQIIGGGDKRDWQWMKECLLASNIWYSNLPGTTAAAADSKRVLFDELLEWVRAESQKQLRDLQRNIDYDKEKNDAPAEHDLWQQLTQFDVAHTQLTELSASSESSTSSPRQDNVPNGVQAMYSRAHLNATATHSNFDGDVFYDYNQYLPSLMLLAQTVDAEFQSSVQKTFNVDPYSNIGVFGEGGGDDAGVTVEYARGPVKTLQRAREKSAAEYRDQPFPTSACCMDFNRCSLVFGDIASMLHGLWRLVNKVRSYESGAVIGIVRVKNGFQEYARTGPQYSDVKVNVLIRGRGHNLVGEVQFLLRTMKRYKAVAHPLYGISRESDFRSMATHKVLPRLLDYRRQLKVFACLGDVASMLRLLVFHNLSARDIFIVDDASQENILVAICKSGQLNALKWMRSMMNESEFVRFMFDDRGSDLSPLGWCIARSHLSLIREALSIPAVRQKYAQSDDWLYRAVFAAFVHCSIPETIDFVLQTLGISAAKLRQLVARQYSDKNSHFYRDTLMVYIVSENRLNVLQKMADLIADGEVFAQHAFSVDFKDFNVVETAIYRDKIATLKFLFDNAYIRRAYSTVHNGTDTGKANIFRILYWIFVRCRNAEIRNFVCDEVLQWKANKQALMRCFEFKYVGKRNFERISSAPQFDGMNIFGQIVSISDDGDEQKTSMNVALSVLREIESRTENETAWLATQMLRSDAYNLNPLERCLLKNDLQLITHLMQMSGLKETCVSDMKRKWRIVFLLSKPECAERIIKYMHSMLNLDEKSLSDLIAFSYPSPTPSDLSALHQSCTKYWNEKLSKQSLSRLNQVVGVMQSN